jgi:ketosteroid isomerase-like protein
MSAANLDLIREIYRRIQRDERFPDELLDDDIEYVNPPDAVEPGIRRGREAFHRAIDRVTDVYEAELQNPEELIEAGENEVVVLVTFVIKGRGSGLEQHQPQGHVWTLRDGKVVRFAWFNDPDEALGAAGIER